MTRAIAFRPARPGEDFHTIVVQSRRRSFQCRYCEITFVGGHFHEQSATEEGDAAFTHMATCPFRPAGKPLTDLEQAALARTGR